MGDRGQVLIVDEKVYLYTHWGASDLIEIVRRALARKQRWDDPEYLARIIFCEMIGDDMKGDSGFGIGTIEHLDIWRKVSVNCERKTVTIEDYDISKEYSFEKFIQQERLEKIEP